MNNPYDQIELYLEAELSESERAAFEAALQQDPLLQEALEEHRAIIEEINGMRLRQIIKKNLQKPSPRVWVNWHYWALASLLLIFISAFVWMYKARQSEAESTPQNAPTPHPNEAPVAGQNKVDVTPGNSPLKIPIPSHRKIRSIS